MRHFAYLAVIIFVAICALGINLGFRLKSFKLFPALAKTQIAILVIYLSWDSWAIARDNWFFDKRQILDIDLLPKVPIEEVLFFIVVPLATIFSYQALLKLTRWKTARDEQ